ncbi:beta-ketoacyl-ACP synthase III [Actinopolymorpha singaporensis]|uniref:Beta-ketoacyl-[acyl-carrier-protein] synthase III n=1 Tax=Actinopolymorpha singaporensis TaxID=117157 RepID=A0A1H1W8U2_9ACTN|nr:beta-ketoacyl-ACP synthase III [Actinopolymorpha singaporensis]SDS93060.1 3-oxoacyl-[acyl-carrier-protein] synthase III [Actinopolymorpha singaporensis]
MTGAIRTPDGTRHAGVLGVGSYRPHRIVTNAEICERIDSSDEWIRTRSGIVSRRWAGPEETVAAMSVAAAGKALAAAGIQADQLGCVLVATVSHLSQTPAVAPIIATELGAQGVAAFDISAACAGFCYGLELARSMVSSGTATYVLVVGVERLSDLTDPEDRSTAFLFGDGAGAAVVGPTEEPGIGPVVWGSDGAQAEVIRQKESWDDAVSDGEFPHLTMQGNPVFRWASYEMAKVAQQALERAGVAAQDLDAFIPHQANNRITDAMVKALNLPGHVVIARDIAEQGNTSAASIPLALDRLLDTSEVRSGDTALVIGFGAGLVYAAQVIRIP